LNNECECNYIFVGVALGVILVAVAVVNNNPEVEPSETPFISEATRVIPQLSFKTQHTRSGTVFSVGLVKF
jgi:hypothetical protein